MNEYIDADAYIEYCDEHWIPLNVDAVKAQPTADVVEVLHGKWEECEIVQEDGDYKIIEEWQSARCSVCGKYHTTPYMYYFDHFNYCPNCGAKMERREDAEIH